MNFDLKYIMDSFAPILAKLPITFYMTIAATILALVVGMIFAVLIEKKIFFLSKFLKFFNSLLKGVPVLIFLYVLYYAMPDVLTSLGDKLGFAYDIKNPPKLFFGILAFGVTYIPYMCEMIITAYHTVPKGQMEACESMGFTTFQAMRRIIAPQMVVVSIPVFGNHFVNILKATSLAYMVTIIEMMGAAKNYATGTQRFLETYIAAAIIYWIICIVFDKLFVLIENNTGKYRNKVAQAA